MSQEMKTKTSVFFDVLTFITSNLNMIRRSGEPSINYEIQHVIRIFYMTVSTKNRS